MADNNDGDGGESGGRVVLDRIIGIAARTFIIGLIAYVIITLIKKYI
ncbi:MAG: hypothetical protein HW407_982 [Bacteroidetes bacterium]|nr:hypothetical protein [Bacteroidota bacterium]